MPDAKGYSTGLLSFPCLSRAIPFSFDTSYHSTSRCSGSRQDGNMVEDIVGDVDRAPEEEACDAEDVLDWMLVWLVLGVVADVEGLELELDIGEPEIVDEEVTDDKEIMTVVELDMTDDPELPLLLVVLAVAEGVEVDVPVLPDVKEEPVKDEEEEPVVPLLLVAFKLALGFMLKVVESPVLVLELSVLKVLVDEVVAKFEEEVVDDCVEVVEVLLKLVKDVEMETSEDGEVVLESVMMIVDPLLEELEVLDDDEVRVVEVSVPLVPVVVVLPVSVDVEEVVRVDELDELEESEALGLKPYTLKY
ncbi:hypothetical protein CPAR01_09520 [Colletotrichum paranaense]|uniref:Uncharacterized protein n=1 Tax=Colletotrichum paranaense TaxID=1914294 RepID=A0ABQ9SI67_9PEZI|nr:uncharacterized protein CPAR01_09520 [Colletotrichum paranaense]KAK1535978.1 hypothetical protein CPAR01_09520 [Colletotrichum paranaense]